MRKDGGGPTRIGRPVVAILLAPAIGILAGIVPARAQPPPAVEPVFITADEFSQEVLGRPATIDDSITGFLRFVSDLNTLQSGRTIPEFDQFRDEASAAVDTVPIPSGSTSITYVLDPQLQIFKAAGAPLAPALSMNARTNGRGVLTVGASYSRVQYEHFEDADRERVIFVATTVQDAEGSAVTDASGRSAIVGELFDFDLRKDIIGLSAQYGIATNLDVGLFIPIISQSFEARTIARFYLQNPDGSVQPALVGFDADRRPVSARSDDRLPPLRRIDDLRVASFNVPIGDTPLRGLHFEDDAFGLGDIVLRGRYFVGSYGAADFGATMTAALPTGDEDDLLGVGAVRVNPGVVVSATGPMLAGHFNATFHVDTEESDRDRFDYSVGGELKLADWLTALVDHVGRLEVSGGNRVQRFEIVPGLKVNPWGDVVIGFNAFVPLNRDGLTTDWIPNGSAEATVRF